MGAWLGSAAAHDTASDTGTLPRVALEQGLGVDGDPEGEQSRYGMSSVAPHVFSAACAVISTVMAVSCAAPRVSPSVSRSDRVEPGPSADDGDGDGIADGLDRCPRLPETRNGVEDDDGCPDRGDVSLAPPIEIVEVISFAPASAALVDRNVLDLVANLLAGNPQITVVELHASAEPSEPDAVGLAMARGEAVRDALVARGVAVERLRVREGEGAGRSVRFVIVARDE